MRVNSDRCSYFGFRIPSETLIRLQDHFRESDGRLIMVMSHTVPADAILGYWALRNLGLNLHVCCNPPPFLRKYVVPWACASNIITTDDHGHGGSTRKVIDVLNKAGTFSLLISPLKMGRPMKSGYWHIARATGAQVVVIGFDYLRRDAYVSKRRFTLEELGDTYDSFRSGGLENTLVAELHHIWPCKPQDQLGFDSTIYHAFHLHSALERERLHTRGSWEWDKYYLQECAIPHKIILSIVLILLFLFVLLRVVARHS